jgi:uncharacterized protein YqgC (DUF456 family)
MTNLVLILVIVAMVIGAAGTILPILPGIPLIFGAALFYGWYEGFSVITPNYLIILGILTLLSILFSYLSTVLGARRFGSGKFGSWGAMVGLVLGIFLIPPLGIIIGPFLGAFIGEYITHKDSSQAFQSSLGALIGLFSGIVFNLLIALGMVVSFIIKVL